MYNCSRWRRQSGSYMYYTVMPCTCTYCISVLVSNMYHLQVWSCSVLLHVIISQIQIVLLVVLLISMADALIGSFIPRACDHVDTLQGFTFYDSKPHPCYTHRYRVAWIDPIAHCDVEENNKLSSTCVQVQAHTCTVQCTCIIVYMYYEHTLCYFFYSWDICWQFCSQISRRWELLLHICSILPSCYWYTSWS